jgi:hypothetical protein
MRPFFRRLVQYSAGDAAANSSPTPDRCERERRLRLRAYRWAPNVCAVLSLAVICIALARVPLAQLPRNYFAFGDLRAFYCAARTAEHGFDPYASEPIGACERGLVGLRDTNFVVPAPLPGQAIALFEPVARLPFSVVATTWCILLGATFAATCAMLVRLTRWRPVYVIVACAPLAFFIPVNQGQLVPLAVGALVAATLAVRSNRDGLAAVLTVAATIEPHIGLPACAALFIARPRSRWTLVAAAAASAALAAWTVTPRGVGEYFARVLPEHIAAEAQFDDQYSLTYLLSWLRVSISDAVTLGQASYWLLASAAVVAAVRLDRSGAGERYLLFVPMAASVIGGPYVHVEHLLAALPLAVLLAATAPAAWRSCAMSALVLLALPAKVALERLHVGGVAMQLNTGFVSSARGASFVADAAWSTRIEPFSGHIGYLIAKVPSWVGLALLVAMTALLVARNSRAIASRVAARSVLATDH